MPEKTNLAICENCDEEFKENQMTTFRHSFIYYQNQNTNVMKVCINCKKFLQEEEKEEYNRNMVENKSFIY